MNIIKLDFTFLNFRLSFDSEGLFWFVTGGDMWVAPAVSTVLLMYKQLTRSDSFGILAVLFSFQKHY